MPHIFISYAKKDTRDLAISLREALGAIPDISVWMDDSLEAGESWAMQIQEEIDRADYILVLISPDVNRKPTQSISRSFVLNEIDYAQQESKRIIPVMVDWTKVPVQIAGMQHIDFLPNAQFGIQKLVLDITRRVGVDFASKLDVNHLKFTNQTYPPKVGFKTTQRLIALVILGVVSFIIGIVVFKQNSEGKPIDERTLVLESTTEIIAISITQALMITDLPASLTSIIVKTTATLPAPTKVPTRINTFTPTYTPFNTSTFTPTMTMTPTLTNFELASTPLVNNIDWKSIEQLFDNVPMVLVPAGCFEMGSTGGFNDEEPVEKQCIETPFWIDKYEVTNGQFDEKGGIAIKQSGWRNANSPRENISWFEARDYCETLRAGRLPTEEEWEYAARGPDNLIYPWGNKFIAENVIYGLNSNNRTADVGSRASGVSWVAALDMSGNVWEWVSSLYLAYPYDEAKAEQDIASNRTRVMRGGSWHSDELYVRMTQRNGGVPDMGGYSIGFRCARSYNSIP